MSPSYEIASARQFRQRAVLEQLTSAEAQLPALPRAHSRLEVQVNARTGATRVRHPGQPWLSID